MELTPSARARELVRGAVDLHVHVAPDTMERRIDDIDLARRFKQVGLAGFVLKSHYVPTAERAAVVRKAVPGVAVLGSVALNSSVGGMNALAVEIAAREGARIVWLPTVDAENETAGHTEPRPGQKLPAWAKMQHELRIQGMDIRPVPVVDRDGRLLPETRRVLQRIAAHRMVLATGHLGRAEIFAVVEAAREIGIEHVVVTHPEFPSQSLSEDDQLELARNGAVLERCFTTPHTNKVSWETWLSRTRSVGPERCVLSTDLGQVDNPNVEDGLPLMADRLIAAGFTEAEVVTMAVTNTRALAGLATSEVAC
ncbi:MAG TPA: DUF6282 family protein [Candidatus Dormibacteraeota bacterium]|nr:DUF6282 family protein [Candidatus Dormibacteraeota bacterium]